MLAAKFWRALPNNQQRLEEISTICAYLCLCRSVTRGVCIIHISTESKHHEINTAFKGKVASREHLNTIWRTEDVYTWSIYGGLSLFIHEPAHPNARAKGQKLFHISFLKMKSGPVVNSNTLLSYQEDLSGLGCGTIVPHFHCSAQGHCDPLKSHQLHQQIISYPILSTSFRGEMN